MGVSSNAAAPQTLMGPVKLAVGIEESRAQRHQHQQSRFRDRGGIFKPSNRNTLLDILMGRRTASPKRSMRRSVSRSPSKADKNPSKVGAGNNAVSTDTPPTKVSRLHQAPVPLKESTPKDVQSNECGTKETSAACTKSQSVAKQRGRPPKQLKSVLIGDSGGSESKGKASKSKPATRKRHTSSQKSKTSTAKPRSKLSSIVEEIGRSEVFGDKTLTATDSGEVKQKKRDAAETFREVHTDDETPTFGKKKDNSPDSDFTVTGTSRDSKKKSNRLMPIVSSKPANEDSTTPNHSCMNKPGKRRRVKSDAISGSTEIDGDRPTTEPDSSVDVNQPFVKEHRLSKPNTRRKRRPDSGNNNEGDENRGPGQKRVKFTTECGKTGKRTLQNGLGAAKTLIPNYRDVASIVEQIPNIANHDDNAKGTSSFISLEMSGAKSKKRIRNPEDSSSTSLKRVKLGNAETKDSELDDDFPAESEGQTAKKAAHADHVAVKKEVALKPVSSSRRSKEDSTVSKKPPKAGAQTKPKAPNKRTKGLPRRVLQRLKQSQLKQSQLDDEPDPIDFLS